MIPKKIHYCWFGKNPLPDDVKKYISTWEKKCPGYEIIEWNENNFDVNINQYVKEAYENRKWAFVSDYVRLYVLIKFGGIYLDTDIEVLKSFDNFLSLDGFTSFEISENKKLFVTTGVIGCKKGFKLFKNIIKYYDDIHFVDANGEFNLTPNPVIFTNFLKERGLLLENKKQVVDNYHIFPNDYFCPSFDKKMNPLISSNSVVIHYFMGSWISNEDKIINSKKKKIKDIFGNKLGGTIGFLIFLPKIVFRKIKKIGFKNTLKLIKNRLFK